MSEEKGWYTTTFKIPIYLSDRMKKFARKRKMTGMNMVVVIACLNFLHTEEEKEKTHEEKANLIEELYRQGVISEKDKQLLWS